MNTYLLTDSINPNNDKSLGNSNEIFVKKEEKLRKVATIEYICDEE